jgi:hypothetical protein
MSNGFELKSKCDLARLIAPNFRFVDAMMWNKSHASPSAAMTS